MKCSKGELNMMNFGLHMGLLEEWNEDSRYDWRDEVEVIYDFPITTVLHRCREWDPYRGMEHETDAIKDAELAVIARYKTDGEGELVSLLILDRHNQPVFDYGQGPPKP